MPTKPAALRDDELPTVRIRPVTALEPTSSRNTSATRRITHIEQRARDLDALHAGEEIAVELTLEDLELEEERPPSAFPLLRRTTSVRRRFAAVELKVTRGSR